MSPLQQTVTHQTTRCHLSCLSHSHAAALLTFSSFCHCPLYSRWPGCTAGNCSAGQVWVACSKNQEPSPSVLTYTVFKSKPIAWLRKGPILFQSLSHIPFSCFVVRAQKKNSAVSSLGPKSCSYKETTRHSSISHLSFRYVKEGASSYHDITDVATQGTEETPASCCVQFHNKSLYPSFDLKPEPTPAVGVELSASQGGLFNLSYRQMPENSHKRKTCSSEGGYEHAETM